MRIGVSIDGVLRDFLGRVEDTFEKYFPSNEDMEPTMVLDYDLDKWLVFPEEEVKQGEMEFDPNFDESKFMEEEQTINLVKSKHKVTVEEFLYEKCTLEIFGYANESVLSAVETLNQLIIDNPIHEFIIISREGGLAIPSTLFFLSKTKSICPNIKFVTEYDKVWDYVDVMITDHPSIINNKPNTKICVKVSKDYNTNDVHSNFTIKSIKEVDSNFINDIENIFLNGNVDWSL